MPYASLAYSSNNWSSSTWRTRLHYFSVRLTTIRKEYLEWSGANAVGGGGRSTDLHVLFSSKLKALYSTCVFYAYSELSKAISDATAHSRTFLPSGIASEYVGAQFYLQSTKFIELVRPQSGTEVNKGQRSC